MRLNLLIVSCSILFLINGCASTRRSQQTGESAEFGAVPSIEEQEGKFAIEPGAVEVIVKGNQAWTDTGIDLEANDAIRINAIGEIEVTRWSFFGRSNYDYKVGPKGTYLFPDSHADKDFPLAAANKGPAPCYCLIGKIGVLDPPFYVGDSLGRVVNAGPNATPLTTHHSPLINEPNPNNQISNPKSETSVSSQRRRLYLGINDFELKDNKGEFIVDISVDKNARENFISNPYSRVIEDGSGERGKPIEDPYVILFYIDGLRYDVLEEMAYNGHLPNIKKYLFDEGVAFTNAFTVFPSETLIANAAMETGLFPDKNGLKSQALYNRLTQEPLTLLDKFSPTDASDLLKLTGIRLMGRDLGMLIASSERYANYIKESSREVDAIYDYFAGPIEETKSTFVSTVLPILPQSPPPYWVDTASAVLPPFSSHKAKHYTDDVNVACALDTMIKPTSKVMMVWFPETDSISHITARGQFGPVRRNIHLADKYIGLIIEKLKKEEMLDNTYMFLYADHGHVGGKTFVNQAFDLVTEVFYKDVIDEDGDGAIDPDSGLGFNILNVDVPHSEYHKGTDKKDFIYIDGRKGGVAKIFLPRGRIDSKAWREPNSFYQLTHYVIDEELQPVNLLDKVLSYDFSDTGRNQFEGIVSSKPIDLAMVKINDDEFIVMSSNGSQALIQKKGDETGQVFRYLVVENFKQDVLGKNTYDIPEQIGADPFRYLRPSSAEPPEASEPSQAYPFTLTREWVEQYHSDLDWLRKTAKMEYPDMVVAASKFMFWDPSQKAYEERYAPDFLITASRGWRFADDGRFFSDHGYPLYESMRIPILVSGPNVKENTTITEPHRIIDILPTVLTIMGKESIVGALDGRPLNEIYKPDDKAAGGDGESSKGDSCEIVSRPGLCTDQGLDFEEPELHRVTFILHDPNNPIDVHSIVRNLFSITGWQVFRVSDGIIDGAIPGDDIGIFRSMWAGAENAYDKGLPDSHAKSRFAQFFNALRLKQLALGDFSYTSSGNQRRVFLLIDWAQDMLYDLDKGVAKPFGREDILGTKYLNTGIDVLQDIVNMLRRVASKYLVILVEDGIIDHTEYAIEGIVNTLPKPKRKP